MKELKGNSVNNKSSLCILMIVCFFVAFLLVPPTVHAALYSTDLGFVTSDQNMWGGGAAVVLEDTIPIGLSWGQPDPLSFHVGDTKEITLPSGCFFGVCWPSVPLGETGAELGGSTDGYIGIEAGYMIDSGSINASYQADVVLTYPDPGTVSPGETFTISSEVIGPNAGFDTNFPEVQAYVDLVFDVYADLYGKAVVLGVGPDFDVTLIDVDITQEIIGFNRDGNGLLTLFGIDTGVVGGEIDLEYGDFTVTLPDIETISTMTGPNTYESAGETNFLELGIDVDKIATDIICSALLLPPGSIALSGDIEGILSYDILDIDVGAELDILQNFLFEPELMISLTTSYGNEYTFAAGDSIDLVMGDSLLGITPTYTLNNTFTNRTSLSIVPEIELAILSASAFGLFDIGPLWEDEFQANIFPPIPVYNHNFSLDFDPNTTARFDIAPLTGPGTEPVPEPATILLLGSGLIGLAGFGSRKKQKIN